MGGVVGEVVRVGGGAGGVFELAVDGFGGFVAGGGLVEVGVDVAGWLVESGARGEFPFLRGHRNTIIRYISAIFVICCRTNPM